jgi:hypothetical protein
MGGEAHVTPVLSLDSSYLNPSYKPCDNRTHTNKDNFTLLLWSDSSHNMLALKIKHIEKI